MRRVPTDWESLLRYTILRAIFRTAQNDAVRVVWEIPKWYKTTGQSAEAPKTRAREYAEI